MIHYHRRQLGLVMIVTCGISMALIVGLYFAYPETQVIMGIAGLAVLAVEFLMGTLAVTVTSDAVEVAYGPGLIRKKLPIANIRTARVVRNPWWYGWGIRLIPSGWMWNVSGLDAVELDLPDGKKFRIGSGDPAGLVAAIGVAQTSSPESARRR